MKLSRQKQNLSALSDFDQRDIKETFDEWLQGNFIKITEGNKSWNDSQPRNKKSNRGRGRKNNKGRNRKKFNSSKKNSNLKQEPNNAKQANNKKDEDLKRLRTMEHTLNKAVKEGKMKPLSEYQNTFYLYPLFVF